MQVRLLVLDFSQFINPYDFLPMKAILIALLLMFSASAAQAQNDQAWRSCNSEDADIAIRGCTLLIDTVRA